MVNDNYEYTQENEQPLANPSADYLAPLTSDIWMWGQQSADSPWSSYGFYAIKWAVHFQPI